MYSLGSYGRYRVYRVNASVDAISKLKSILSATSNAPASCYLTTHHLSADMR